MNKKFMKILLFVALILIITFYIIFANCFNLINNYFEKGYANKYGAVAGPIGAYERGLYSFINTIIENDDYGVLVIKNNGRFIYYPGYENLFETKEENVYKYEGVWYLSDKLRFTITRTTLNKYGFNLLFKDFEYTSKIHFNFIKDGWYSDNLFINGIEFQPVEKITENQEKRLFLDNEIIDKFLKENK